MISYAKKQRYGYIRQTWMYQRIHYSQFDYNFLSNIFTIGRAGQGDNPRYNDIIIMADTETSKEEYKVHGKPNHVCAWSIALYAFDMVLCTLYGNKPSELIECMERINQSMKGERTVIYYHNMAYDYTFLRQYMYASYGHPVEQLNTKPYYPIMMRFNNGIILKDSLILAQRSIEKWAKDMNVQHQKQVGKWDYDAVRNQDHVCNDDELDYIECDVVAGVECIAETMRRLNKLIYSIPLTATGIPREQVRIRGKKHNAHDWYVRVSPDAHDQKIDEQAYHGGYVHGNRHYLEYTITKFVEGLVKCYDFSSSYPFCMLAYRYPCERFRYRADCDIDYILQNSENYAYIFKLRAYGVKLKDPTYPMPALQWSKCIVDKNSILDNGRILRSEYIEIYLTEIDLQVIASQYDFDVHECVEVRCAEKAYLPRWFTDYVYECYKNKCELKGGDPVAYAIAKAIVNSLYGMCCQKPVKEVLVEDYETGEYNPTEAFNYEEEYQKHVEKHTSVLPYFIGIYVTSYAMRNLFELGACCDLWLYSDTDSCYGVGWDEEKVKAYNEKCRTLLRNNGYDAVVVNGREFWLGIAEHDPEEDTYSEFRYCGAKRYCGRHDADGSLKLTTAGVPKKGVACLEDDINNFTSDMIFDGETTGKLQHTRIYQDMTIDDKGNEVADSIDLSPCNYQLRNAFTVELSDYLLEELMMEEVEMEVSVEDE